MEKRQLRERPPSRAEPVASSSSRSASSRSANSSSTSLTSVCVADNRSAVGIGSSFAISSSSEYTSSSSSARKRTREINGSDVVGRSSGADDDTYTDGRRREHQEEVDDAQVEGSVRQLFNPDREAADMGKWSAFTVTPNETAKWDKLPEDTRQRCVNIVSRLLLFKGKLSAEVTMLIN